MIQKAKIVIVPYGKMNDKFRENICRCVLYNNNKNLTNKENMFGNACKKKRKKTEINNYRLEKNQYECSSHKYENGGETNMINNNSRMRKAQNNIEKSVLWNGGMSFFFFFFFYSMA